MEDVEGGAYEFVGASLVPWTGKGGRCRRWQAEMARVALKETHSKSERMHAARRAIGRWTSTLLFEVTRVWRCRPIRDCEGPGGDNPRVAMVE